jgi:hypothetical protein
MNLTHTISDMISTPPLRPALVRTAVTRVTDEFGARP